MSVALKNITRSFGSKRVIENFSAEFKGGTRTAIVSYSGSGKTTLFRIIASLDKRFSGICEVRGKVALMFQEDRLFEHSTVLENVCAVAENEREKAELILAELGLAECINDLPSTLSGGMKRRVALARTLLYDGDVILLDECFSGLDAETKANTAQVINKYIKNKTLILITHDKSDAELLSCEVREYEKGFVCICN